MASIGHVAIGLAARKFYEGDIVPRWPPLAGMFLWSGLSLLPDADVAGFSFGIPYSSQFGHRGATHSIAFAVAVGVAAYVIAGREGTSKTANGPAGHARRREPQPARYVD